jgi:hypothetical protein
MPAGDCSGMESERMATSPDPSTLVTVGRFREVWEAHLARAELESEGIFAHVADEQMVTMNWLYSNALGGVRLQVPAMEADRAREILSDRVEFVILDDDASPEEEKAWEEAVPGPCPRCGSENVSRKRFATWSLFLNILLLGLLLRDDRLQCEECRYKWEEGEEDSSAAED